MDLKWYRVELLAAVNVCGSFTSHALTCSQLQCLHTAPKASGAPKRSTECTQWLQHWHRKYPSLFIRLVFMSHCPFELALFKYVVGYNGVPFVHYIFLCLDV